MLNAAGKEDKQSTGQDIHCRCYDRPKKNPDPFGADPLLLCLVSYLEQEHAKTKDKGYDPNGIEDPPTHQILPISKNNRLSNRRAMAKHEMQAMQMAQDMHCRMVVIFRHFSVFMRIPLLEIIT